MTNGVNHSERAHSILGASSSHRWLACPGSIQLAATIPEHDTDSFFAREGTAAHELAEKCLTHGTDPAMYVGQKINRILVTKEMASAVGIFVDRVRTLAEATGEEPLIEVRVSLEDLDPPVDMFGTADAVVYDELRGKHLHVLDYKHGQGIVVEPEENPQLLYYALGVVLKLKVKPRKITVWIIQPRAPHPDGIVREWTFEWERLVRFKEELMVGAYRTQDENPPLQVGTWCRFCPAAAICPKQKEHAVATVGEAFLEAEGDELYLPEPETLDDDTVNRALLAAPMVEDWFKALRDYASKRYTAGAPVPGWKLVAKRSPRRWVDQQSAEEYLRGLNLEDADLFTRKLISPRQAEIALRREGVEIPHHLITNESQGENLVVESDPRPAVETVAEAFANDENE